ncbi:nuclear transport factor 2 family protein [Corallococcus carmarthensis]|uniref:Nuclear transport factor 2 family protein n=1 Tax=Corallococcus carmarthensis TaxID=2316728 RepID=A0A3A8K8P4_9BACT|nr:nuclear transport factor 2 family protein [Corallococcus carmarthensis]NOK19877.1 nuclear transport factor 2 family protein [Corallococcus carmarthensis]RKH04523.1 nuclear transport factor 2 family protein [Corallococcus carmarthensis]
MSQSSPHLEFTRRYLQALEAGTTGEALAAFFHPEVRQHEHPNRLTPQGTTRDLAGLLASAERGLKAVSAQRYEVTSALCVGDTVAVEAEWSATLRVPVGNLPAGGTMRASLGMFFTFRDGRIVSQRNYDCFQPF